jgi:hypothetical protein
MTAKEITTKLDSPTTLETYWWNSLRVEDSGRTLLQNILWIRYNATAHAAHLIIIAARITHIALS